MIVSTRGRYAMRVLIDIAENQEGGKYIALKEIAERQDIYAKPFVQTRCLKNNEFMQPSF